MFWDKIKDKCNENNLEYEVWSTPYMLLNNRDGICGIKVKMCGVEVISIISHSCSYGGREGLFEIMKGDDGEVEGFLSESEIIKLLDEFTIKSKF